MAELNKEFKELIIAIGTVTYHWAQIERQLENWIVFIFFNYDATSIRKDVPRSLKAKIAFLCISFRKFDALAKFKLHALDLLQKVSDNAENRHSFVHGTVYSLTPKSFEFTRLKSFEPYYLIEKNKFSTKTYKALLNDLSILYDDTALLSESLLKMTPRKK